MLCGMLVAMVTCELVAETEQTRTRRRKDGQYAVLPPISVDREERDRMSSSEHNQYDIMMIDDIIIIINVDLYSMLSSKKTSNVDVEVCLVSCSSNVASVIVVVGI